MVVETAPAVSWQGAHGPERGARALAPASHERGTHEDDWLVAAHADRSTGLTLLTGCPRPTERRESTHLDIEVAIPGPAAVVRLTCQSATGQETVSHVRGHHVSVIPDGQPHQVEWRAQAPLTVLFLQPALVERACAELATGGSVRLRESYTAIDPVLRQLGLSAQNALLRGGFSALYASSLAHVLAVHLMQNYGFRRAAAATLDARLPNHVLRRATEFMLSNLAVNIHLEDVAQAAGLSRFHFAHLFKNTTGMGPHRYLTLARVERAKELLRGTETELSALAQHLGFADQSHMTTVFKRFTGTTPNCYRQAVQA
jgi:AraC family transcriptional regulator